MYEAATKEPYSFWYILLTAKLKDDMFFLRFEQKITVADAEDAYYKNIPPQGHEQYHDAPAVGARRWSPADSV